jgi:hypothetical protein
MATLATRVGAAVGAFRNPVAEMELDELTRRYDALMWFWEGNWRGQTWYTDQRVLDPMIYKNTRQIWRHARATVALYTQFVYAGSSLSAGTEPLSDGTRGAIPIDPDTGSETDDARLREAIESWWKMVNFRQFMSQRPKYGSILGDCLTELVDDRARAIVRPVCISPKYVKYLDLDAASNVKAYSVEWLVSLPETKLFGTTQEAQQYRYRKDVNTRGFWYYRDDKLERFDENPYGFVPALWDRHEIVFGDRGLGALDATFQQAVELNSILSHAFDYQGKQFGAPIGVKGASINSRNNPMKLNARQSTGDPLADAAMVAQSLGLLPMSENGDFITINFDIGKTTDLVKLLMESVLAENPEASYSQQILEMTQVTAPCVERALGPIVGMVKEARKNYDTQTIKLTQMALAMMGWRLQTSGYPREVVVPRRNRYERLAIYDLESYGKGLLDFTIPDRAVIPDTIDERIARQLQIEMMQWEYSLKVSGMPEEEVTKIMSEREAEKERANRLEEIATGVAAGDNEPVDA